MTFHREPIRNYPPEELEIEKSELFLRKQIRRKPILRTYLNIVISPSFQRKLEALQTTLAWKNWAYFYQQFLVDTYLRAKNAKVYQLSSLILGIYFLMTNISTQAWEILQKLRIITSKQVVENWITNHPKQLRHNATVLFYSFDNCNFYQHVTHVRAKHQNQMLHIITRYIFEI